jgi:hypothetical protein
LLAVSNTQQHGFLRIHGPLKGCLILPNAKQLPRFHVAAPPPGVKRGLRALLNGGGQRFDLQQRLSNSVTDDEIFVVARVSRERPARADCFPEEETFTERSSNFAVGPAACEPSGSTRPRPASGTWSGAFLSL